MLKLISLNIEGPKHYDTIFPFIKEEKPDVLCLQEAPEEMREKLQELGYFTSFAPMFIRTFDNIDYVIGVMIVSKLPQKTNLFYYWQSATGIPSRLDTEDQMTTESNAYLMANIFSNNQEFNIATTHVMDTKNGAANENQEKGVCTLLDALGKEPSHIICGDFNMPRGYNHLYEKFTGLYKDEIPSVYQSSLDRNLHRMGKVKIDEPIFDKFMVDYIFSKPEYKVSEVRLKFGVSDNAAVIAKIEKA